MKKLKNALQLSIILSLVVTTLVNLNPVYASPGTAVSVEGGGIGGIDGFPIIEPGGSFDVNIVVTEIPSAWPLLGYDFKLSYYTDVLDVYSFTIGNIFGTTPGIDYRVWHNEVNETGGYVWLAVSQMEGESGVTGGGTLATITFQVAIWGGTPLDLYDDKLSSFDPVKNDAVPIEHDAIDGEFSDVGMLPIALFSWLPSPPEVGKSVTFDGTGSYDPDGLVVGWDWDFGDGTYGSGSTIEHVFTDVGIYTVTLKVTDNALPSPAMNKLSQTVWVIPPQLSKADLVEWKARPEHKTFDKSLEMKKDGNITNSLYAYVQSLGGWLVVVKVRFTVTDALTGTQRIIETNEIGLAKYLEIYTFDTALDVIPLWTEFDTTSITTKSKFTVKAECLYKDPTEWPEVWRTGAHTKTFSFTVKP